MKKPISFIEDEEIIQRAVRLVKSTKKTLTATMLLSEEKGEVASEYANALGEALDRGIKIKRVCFGTKQEFKKFRKSFDKRIDACLVEKKSTFQRMIISDGSAILFRLSDKCYCDSLDSNVVLAFHRYIDSLLSL